MIWLALRNVLHRSARSVTTIIGIGIVTSVGFVLAGVTAGFSAEVERTLDAIGDEFVVPEGATGIVTGLTAQDSGPAGSAPLLFARDVTPDGSLDLNLFGLDAPDVTPQEGRATLGPGEIILDASADVELGQMVVLAGQPLEVVGVTDGIRLYAGGPVGFMTLADMQRLYFDGQPVARAFIGDSPPLDPGLRVLGRDEARNDLDRPVRGAIDSLALTRTLLWVIVAGVVFSVGRLTMLDRWHELAALRCLGASVSALGGGLIAEGLFIGVTGAGLGWLLGEYVLAPTFPLAVEATAATGASLIVIAAMVTLASGLVSAIRLRSIEPQVAFRGVQ